MRTICSFPHCKSGSAGDRQRNKALGVRNKALFKFPKKNLSLRKQWETVIGREAKDNEVLCQLHFHTADILKNYEILLPNGVKHIIKRGNISLNSTAIPQDISHNTPDGVIKLKHWKSIINLENHPFALKVAYKLTEDHINPKYYQKMNVPMAFQLFSKRVSVAMQLLQPYDPDLDDCQPTVDFINHLDSLIEVMMSREPGKALRLNSSSHTVIKEFLEYLKKWEKECKEKDYDFLTESTCYGLKITLQATLEILEFLTFEHNYEYLMTARLNQDALERFFSLGRGVCGSNDHPDSILFGQMFRLMSTYSLIKPCKGSNVSGGEMLSALINFNDVSQTSSGRQEWQTIIDSIIEKGNSGEITNNINSCQDENPNANTDDISRIVITYMAGYVVRNYRRWTTCANCIENIQSTSRNQSSHKMIALMDKGYLKYPSYILIQLLEVIENTILKIIETEPVNCDTVFQITYALQELSLPLIGCSEHKEDLTKAVVSFYIIIRAEFLSKSFNKNNYSAKQKTRKARKDAKL